MRTLKTPLRKPPVNMRTFQSTRTYSLKHGNFNLWAQYFSRDPSQPFQEEAKAVSLSGIFGIWARLMSTPPFLFPHLISNTCRRLSDPIIINSLIIFPRNQSITFTSLDFRPRILSWFILMYGYAVVKGPFSSKAFISAKFLTRMQCHLEGGQILDSH